MASIAERIQSLQQIRDGELGGKLEELEKDLVTAEKAVVTTESALKAVKDNIKGEEKKRTQIQKGMTSVSKITDATRGCWMCAWYIARGRALRLLLLLLCDLL